LLVPSAMGQPALPSYVPPPGRFAEFTLNTPRDSGPEAQSMILSHWAGGAFISDYSAHGGVAYQGGREHFAYKDYGGVLVLDIEARRYEMRCVPAISPQESATFQKSGWLGAPTDEYGAFANNGYPQRTHTYNGIQEMPAEWGGGSRGSMVLVSHSGGGSSSKPLTPAGMGSEGWAATWQFDLSQRTDGHRRLTGDQKYDYGNGPSVCNDSPCTGIDYTRKGWWSKPRTGANQGGGISFTSHDGRITNYASASRLRLENSWAQIHHFGDDDLLVVLAGGSNQPELWITIPPDKQGAQWTRVLQTPDGPPKSPMIGYMGMRWCGHPNLQCFIGLDCWNQPDPKRVQLWKLKPPPAGQRFKVAWQWSTEVVSSADGSEINVRKDHASVNGVFGKLVYCPPLKSLVWTRAIHQKGQLIRLSDMT
jgi:hypothetical protein